jgi:hypothetical protein
MSDYQKNKNKIDQFERYQHARQPCLNCRRLLDAAVSSHKDSEDPATPGCLSICIYCSHLMVFDHDMRLRDMTADELDGAFDDEHLLMVLKALAKLRRNVREPAVEE